MQPQRFFCDSLSSRSYFWPSFPAPGRSCKTDPRPKLGVYPPPDKRGSKLHAERGSNGKKNPQGSWIRNSSVFLTLSGSLFLWRLCNVETALGTGCRRCPGTPQIPQIPWIPWIPRTDLAIAAQGRPAHQQRSPQRCSEVHLTVQ